MPPREQPKRNWCFTINNWTEEEHEQLVHADNVSYMIIGKEIGEGGTRHLQGYVQLTDKKRLSGVKEMNQRAHWEPARGSPEDNKKYCSKDGDFTEIGEISIQGKQKCDLKGACEMKANGASISEIIEQHGSGYIMHKRKIDDAADELKIEQNKRRMKILMEEDTLREWQQQCLERLLEQDDRKILFIVDEVGNMGKTYLSKYLVVMKGAVRFENGRSVDIKHGYNGEKIVIFDMTRSAMEHMNYEAIEALKNGIMYSTKYESRMKIYDPPKMIIFMNTGPDMSKLSMDRYDIVNINTMVGL